MNGSSDHLLVFVLIQSKIPQNRNRKSCNRHDYSNFSPKNSRPPNQPSNEALYSGILLLEPCLNEQAPTKKNKKLSKARETLSHKPWITPDLFRSIKTKNGLYRVLVHSGFSRQKARAKYKIYNKKIRIYWKLAEFLLER